MRGCDPVERRERILPIFGACASTVARVMREDFEAGVLDLERAELLFGIVGGLCNEATASVADAPSLACSESMTELLRAHAEASAILSDIRGEAELLR